MTRVGVMLPRDLPVAEVLDHARRADALGFDELWVVEDLGSAVRRMDRPGLEVITYDAAVVGVDGAKARELVRPGLAWVGEPDWAPHLAPLPFADEIARHRQESGTPQRFAASMKDEWVRALSLAGTAEEVRGQIAARHAAGATSVVLIPAEPDRSGSLERLAQVLPG